MERQSYPSDITREQFEIIRPVLEAARKHTRPRTIDLYDIFCGVVYVLTSGCQWRMLPRDYPKWYTCYHYFSIWSDKKDESSSSVLEEVLKKTSPTTTCPPRQRSTAEHGNN